MHRLIAIYLAVQCVVSVVHSAGLREEFRWSRITFRDELDARFTRPESADVKRRPYRPDFEYSDYLIFPGDHSGEIFDTTSRPPRPQHTALTPSQKPSSPKPSPIEITQRPTPIPDNPLSIDYIYENNIPMGVNRWNDKLFITIPRRRAGVPATLNYVPINSKQRENVPLIPYPDQETNLLNVPAGQDHLVSTYRVAIDPCDRLWLVDTGIIETLGNPTTVQPQRIVIIDLNTDQIIKTYNFKGSDLTPLSVLADITVDVSPGRCDDAYAYIPDLAGYAMIVYSLKQDNSWKVAHNYFYLESLAGEFNIGGIQFQWNDGVFSVTLTPKDEDGFRYALFHSMAGTHLFAVSTRILRNETLATRSYHADDFTVIGDRGPLSQTSSSDLHQPTGIVFFALVNQNAVGCYNINMPFKKEHLGIVQKNDTTMIYPADLKIYKDDLIVITTSMPIFQYSHLDYDQINFRVWINNVHQAVKGTVCQHSV